MAEVWNHSVTLFILCTSRRFFHLWHGVPVLHLHLSGRGGRTGRSPGFVVPLLLGVVVTRGSLAFGTSLTALSLNALGVSLIASKIN